MAGQGKGLLSWGWPLSLLLPGSEGNKKYYLEHLHYFLPHQPMHSWGKAHLPTPLAPKNPEERKVAQLTPAWPSQPARQEGRAKGFLLPDLPVRCPSHPSPAPHRAEVRAASREDGGAAWVRGG